MSNTPEAVIPEFPRIDSEYISKSLVLQVSQHKLPAAEELAEVIRDSKGVQISDLYNAAIDALSQRSERTAASRVNAIAQNVLSQFPEAYQEEPPVTARHFLRVNGHDQSRRHLLTQAKQKAETDCKQELGEALQTDYEEHQNFDYELTLDVLNASLYGIMENTQQRAKELTDRIVVELPKEVLMHWGVSTIMPTLNEITGVDVVTNDDGELLMHNRPVNTAKINRMMGELTRLIRFVKSPDSVAASMADQIHGQVKQEVEAYIRDRFEQLARKAANELLPVRLEQAYRAAANQEYTYISVAERERQAAAMPEVALELLPDQTRQAIPVTDFEVDSLDTIESPFPWLKDSDVTLKLISANGENLLFCEALPPVAQKIAAGLRRDPVTRKKLDAMREMFLKIEATNPAARHIAIDRVKGELGDDYRGLVINKFSNGGTMAKRVYYIKTHGARYPEVAAVAADYGLPESTTLLAQVGETDKANQLRLFGCFGIARALAKERGVGPS